MSRATAVVAALYAGMASLGAQAEVLSAPAGTGPWPAIAEQRSDLPTHTIYHPAQLPKFALPLFVWGNGGCRDNGLAHGAFLRQIASYGYFVVAVGHPRQEVPLKPAATASQAEAAPRSGGPQTPDETQVAQLGDAIDWAAREEAREDSPFHGRIDLKHVAVGGHSCGGLQALAISADPRVGTSLIFDSGIYVRPGGLSGVHVDKAALQSLHGPMLYLSGGPTDIAYENAADDVARIEQVPVFFGSLPVGHGGTFWTQPDGGKWARVAVRWLDWQFKGDADAGWDFAGPECRLCTDPQWTVVQKHLGSPVGPLRSSRYVTVRDGTRLAVNIYRPAVDGRVVQTPSPVLFSFTPYRARFRAADGRAEELGRSPRLGLQQLADRGYVIATADIRGKGASFGARRGFQDRSEAHDGRDLVQWLAQQPWSSGKLGMVGCSYLGGTTVQVASTAPPALKAIFTGATDIDKYAFVRRGGITAQFNTRPDEPLSDDLMSLPMDEDPDGAMLRTAVAQHAINTPMAPLWYGMPFRDSVSKLTGNRFWEEVGPYSYIDAIQRSGIATYYWGNWQDEPTEQVIQAAANLGSRLLIGPGSHCVPPPNYDLGGEMGRYFDYYLKGVDTGLAQQPRVTYWLNGAAAGREWQHSEHLPGTTVARTSWYLAPPAGAADADHRDGRLTRQVARRGSAKFRVDYDVGNLEYFAFWVASQQAHGVRYTGPTLRADLTMVGYPIVDLQIAADRSDINVFAYLEDLAPDGTASVVSLGRLAASHRKLSKAPYDTLGLPWHSGFEADIEALVPGRPARLQFSLTPSAWIFKAGHRMRFVVTGADPRQRNLAELRQDPPPEISVISGGNGPSRVEIPVLKPGQALQ